MTALEFQKLQEAQLEIMDEIHRLCQKHDIRYYMIGGTMLGAIRHRGFIPWDLDIDVAMPRDSYSKFKCICEKDLSQRFQYRDYSNTKDFRRPHALISIRNTKLYSKDDHLNRSAENLGIYLDIFPLDTAPEKERLQEKQAKELRFLRKVKAYRVNYCFSDKFYKRALRALFRLVFCWISVDRLNKIADAVMQRYTGAQSTLLCSMASHYAYKKQCMPESIYGEPKLYAFAGREYYGIQQYDEYLRRIYGDYMKLPPVEQQKRNLDEFVEVKFDR